MRSDADWTLVKPYFLPLLACVRPSECTRLNKSCSIDSKCDWIWNLRINDSGPGVVNAEKKRIAAFWLFVVLHYCITFQTCSAWNFIVWLTSEKISKTIEKDWFEWLAVLLFCLSKPISGFIWVKATFSIAVVRLSVHKIDPFSTGAAMTCWWTPSLRWSTASPRSGLRSTSARSTLTINPFPVSLENGVRIVRKYIIRTFKSIRSEKVNRFKISKCIQSSKTIRLIKISSPAHEVVSMPASNLKRFTSPHHTNNCCVN